MIKCIIIDDEPLARELMQAYISKVPFLELKASCGSAFEAVPLIQAGQADLLFLDINMPDVNGIQFLKTLRNGPAVIFTTAYDQYAVEGYTLDVVDFLLKPISFERFLKAANKAHEYITLRQGTSKATEAPAETESNKDYLFVKDGYRIVKININDLFYIEGYKDYIKIHTSAERPVLTLLSLKDILTKLPQGTFVRVHRSYIVCLDKITSVERNRILIKGKEIPIGEHFRDEFLKVLET